MPTIPGSDVPVIVPRLGKRLRTLPQGMVLCTLVLVLAGCNSPPDAAANPWLVEPYSELANQAIEDAIAGGAGQQQLDLLRESLIDGEMSLEAARVATRNAIECFADMGGTADYSEQTDPTGLTIPWYSVGFDAELGDAQIGEIVRSCENREVAWVNKVYQLQPSSRELLGRYVEAQEPVLRTCIERQGLATDPEATGWELAHLALDIAIESDFKTDCLSEANISSL